jgi:hypothetical protein
MERSPAGGLSRLPIPRSFLNSESALLKHSAKGCPRYVDEPVDGMKQKEAKPLVIEAWNRWSQKRGIERNDATGRDLLQFYYELQDAKSPLLKFMSRGRDKWLIIHEWLSDEQQT